MSYRRLFAACAVVSILFCSIPSLVSICKAQPSSSTPIVYEGELRRNIVETGMVNSSQRWDFWLTEARAGTPIEITVVETNSQRTDLFVYQGAGEFPSGSFVSELGPILAQNTGSVANPRIVSFTPDFTGPITIVVEYDDCCSDATYDVSGTGIGQAGLVDLVAPNGFFELGQRLSLSILLSDSSLSRTPGDVSRISGIDFRLTFNPSLVTIDSITLGADVSSWLLSSNLTTLGEAHVALSSLSPVSAIFAQLELVQVHFRAVGTRGDALLSIWDSHIFDDGPVAIDHGLIDGVLIVGCDAGDVVKTGDVNTADTIKTLRFATQLDVPSTEEFCAADINNDEVINTSDAVLNLQRVVGLTRDSGAEIALPAVRVAAVSGRTVLDLLFDAAVGVESEIRYDASKLRLRHVTQLDGGLTAINDLEPGVLRLAAVAAAPREGSLRVAFDRIAPGDTNVRLANLQAFDVNGVPFDHQGRGLVTFVDGSDDPVEPRVPVVGIVRAGPNPFNPRIEFGIRVAQPGAVSLEIYDLKGRQVRSLVVNAADDLEHSVVWDGTDERGHRLASGVYHVRMVAGSVVDQVRVLLLK
jgi:hypothetical protein